MPELLTTAKAAKMLGYSSETVRVMCEKGRIVGAFRPGGAGSHWRIPLDAIQGIIASNRPVVVRRLVELDSQ